MSRREGSSSISVFSSNISQENFEKEIAKDWSPNTHSIESKAVSFSSGQRNLMNLSQWILVESQKLHKTHFWSFSDKVDRKFTILQTNFRTKLFLELNLSKNEEKS